MSYHTEKDQHHIGITGSNQKPHTKRMGLEFNEFLADIAPVPPNTLEKHSKLFGLVSLMGKGVDNQSVLYLPSNIPILTGDGKGEVAQTANSIALVLSDNQGMPVTLASYSLDNPQKHPYILDTSLFSGFILGNMGVDNDWWCVDRLDDGIKLYTALTATKPATVIVSINTYQFIDMVKHFAEIKQVNINITIDKKDKLIKQLAGVNANLWASIVPIADCMDYQQLPDDIIKASDTVKIDLAMMAWGIPENLTNDPSIPTPYPIEAWSGLLQKVIKKIAYYAQVPHAMAGQCVLGALAHMGQRYVNAPLGHGHIPTSLILITEGGSGCGKSSAMRLSHNQINLWENNQYQIYTELLDEWQKEKALSTGKELREFLATSPMPVNQQSIFKDGTIEPILDKFINNEIKNASWSTDEAGQFFNSYTMKGETAGSAMGAITQLYDNGYVNRVRSQKSVYANPRTQAYDIRFTLFLMGQRIILEPALTNALLNEQGILARGLIACPNSLQGCRTWNDAKRRQQSPYLDTDLTSYWNRCKHLLDPVPSNDPDIKKTRINISWQCQNTEQVFYEHMQRIENQQALGGSYEPLKAYASRMGENASRIAALMVFFDGRESINTDDINRAFALVGYHMSERLRYIDITSEAISDTQKLSNWLVKKARDKSLKSFVKGFISRNAPNAFRNKKKLAHLLDELVEANHIKIDIDGRKQTILINPRLLE